MKKVLVGVALSGASMAVLADGYLGADLSLGKVSGNCEGATECQQKHKGFQLRFGSKLPDSLSFKMDDMRVDTLELGVAKVGSVVARGTKTIQDFSNGNYDADFERRLGADVLFASVVGHYDVAPDLSLVGRLGVAYVAGTLSTKISGVTQGPVTENHLSPLIGIGVEYKLIDGFKLNAGLQTFKVKVNGESGRANQLTMGGQYEF